jgi:SanA protein
MVKKLALFFLILIIIILLGLILSNYLIIQSQRKNIFRDPSLLVTSSTVIVLGTSPLLRGGSPNPFFHGRIKSTHQLVMTGNVQKIIVSGSQELPFYNEPAAMKQALMDRGIDPDLIMKDITGVDTFRSVSRLLSQISSLDPIVIVTQEFHAYRALFIAEQLGITAQAFAAPDILGIPGVSVGIREIFARYKAVIDVLVFHLGLYQIE